MSDPRPALRAVYGHWLRVRDRVRALEASLAAAEHRLQRDARRSDDPAMATLAEQLSTERQALQALAAELDARIAAVKSDGDAIASTHVEAIVAAARTTRRDLTAALRIRGDCTAAPGDENERA
jgi:hypothetical protein